MTGLILLHIPLVVVSSNRSLLLLMESRDVCQDGRVTHRFTQKDESITKLHPLSNVREDHPSEKHLLVTTCDVPHSSLRVSPHDGTHATTHSTYSSRSSNRSVLLPVESRKACQNGSVTKCFTQVVRHAPTLFVPGLEAEDLYITQ